MRKTFTVLACVLIAVAFDWMGGSKARCNEIIAKNRIQISLHHHEYWKSDSKPGQMMNHVAEDNERDSV